ncbi:MAG: hypothetical protein AAF492_02735, partial [Verrucomicrobiota bacterium]
TQAKFHKGGKTWSSWNKQFAKALVTEQAEDGHWDFPKTTGQHGHEHGANNGPVYSTTLCALMLQVYYRNLPTFKEEAAEAQEFDDAAMEGEDVVIEIL